MQKERPTWLNYFSKGELALWLGSMAVILGAFLAFRNDDYLSLVASLIGVTSLIFNAKGNPLGPLLMVLFSLLYGIISYRYTYYGEMLTYVGMTAPMSLFSLIVWLKHPYGGNRAEVAVDRLKPGEWLWMLLAAAAVTAAFYYILAAFNTANLPLSTLSVTTSFLAVYLTFRRSPFYALTYAANDIVLILLWALAAQQDRAYLSVLLCFLLFFCNDVYGFVSWRKIQKRQNEPPAV